jgi:fido (protein-threonine AMPylation protein)
LFDGVRDHAGRYRNVDYGEERLNFGPNRSAAREHVPNELAKHIRIAKNLFDQLISLEAKLAPTQFVSEVIKAALYLHAELIRIHPFRDGNGRISRLCITYCLCKFGLPPIIFEVLKQEYIDCLNYYYKNDDLDPLVKLSLRIYHNQVFEE